MKNNNNSLVTVIIPTHGRSDVLERAIRSIEKQTYSNIEIIVVDDNSNDPSSRNKVVQIVKKHTGVKLILNKTNMGGSKSRNVGIEYAKGDYIAFLDDDDEFLPTKIEKQYSLYEELKNEKVGMIYCYANFIYKDGRESIKKVDLEGRPIKEHLISCIAATSWWFCPKKALLDIGGFVDVSSHQDAITLFKMMLVGYKVYRVPEVLLNYYMHVGDGITEHSNKWIEVDKYYMNEYLIIQDMFTRKENKEICYSFYRRMASYDYVLGNRKKLLLETCNMVKIFPFRIDTLKAIVKCVLSIIRRRINE